MNGRIAAGIGLLVVLVAALFVALRSGDNGNGGGPGATTTTAATALTTTIPPSVTTSPTTAEGSTTTSAPTDTSTTVDPNAPPVPDTGDLTDPEAVWTALLAYHNWAFRNPGDAELDRYLDPRCACADFIGDQIADLVANGWREDDEGIVLDRIDVNIQSSDGIVMDVYDRHVEQRIVDADGEVVEIVPERGLARFAVTLVLDAEHGWRIFDWQFVSSVGDA